MDDYVNLYGQRDVAFAPGTRWAYSNYGMLLLGVVIERVSGQSYYDYVDEHVYEPAGNVDSWMAVGDEPVIVHITSYGAMEYLGPSGDVVKRDSASSLRDAYLRYCADNGVAPLDLGGTR